SGNTRVRRVDKFGTITTIAGNGSPGFSGDGGVATSASLGFVFALFADKSGNIYLADSSNNRIRKIDAATRIIKTVTGNGAGNFSGDGGGALSAAINSPRAVVSDRDGNIFVATFGTSTIRVVRETSGG